MGALSVPPPVLTPSITAPPGLAPWETERKELVGLVSAYAFIEMTQVLAKMPLSYGAFKPQGRQSEQLCDGQAEAISAA